MLCFFASKGGVGCSVTAAATSLLSSAQHDTLLVDVSGDQCDLLAVPDDQPGLREWLTAPSALPDTLARLEMRVSDRLSLLPGGDGARVGRVEPDRLTMLAALLAEDGRRVVVDVGRTTGDGSAETLLGLADRTVLVVRPCYLALRAATEASPPDDVVLIDEPGRALRPDDVAAALDTGSLLVIPHDLGVARRVDAGLLASRLPRSLRPLRGLL